MNHPSPLFRLAPAALAGLLAAAIGPVLWIACHKLLGPGAIWIPMVGVGAWIGVTMRLIARSSDPRVRILAVILTILSAIPANLWWDSHLFTPFMIQESIKRMTANLQFVLLTAVGCYLAHRLACATTPGTSPGTSPANSASPGRSTSPANPGDRPNP